MYYTITLTSVLLQDLPAGETNKPLILKLGRIGSGEWAQESEKNLQEEVNNFSVTLFSHNSHYLLFQILLLKEKTINGEAVGLQNKAPSCQHHLYVQE